jgi:hypothetical protein
VLPTSANHSYYGITYSPDDKKPALDVYEKGELKQTFKNIDDVAYTTDYPQSSEFPFAIAISQNYVAMGKGESYPSQERAGKKPKKDYVVEVYTIKDRKKVASVNLGKINTVDSIQVDNSGKYISATFDGSLTVYKTGSGQVVYSYPYLMASRPMWIKGGKLIYGLTGKGLFQLDAKNKKSVTLFSNDKLLFSSYQILGDRLLMTAYPEYYQQNNLSVPDGYIVYLNQPANDDNQLVSKLPAQKDSVMYSTLRGAIYAAPIVAGFTGPNPEFRPVKNVSPAFKSKVEKFLKNNIDNYKKYKLIYGENLNISL